MRSWEETKYSDELIIKPSIDEKRLSAVVDEIKAAGGDVIGVAGDVGADDFPKKIVDATIRFVEYPQTHLRLILN